MRRARRSLARACYPAGSPRRRGEILDGSAIIGHTGFVGGNLVRQRRFDAVYNSRNIGTIRGRGFELLVFAGAQSKKWWANQHPEADWAGIENALGALREVEVGRVVLISTVDVLPNLDGADEDREVHGLENHAYGRNRLRLEDELRARFPRVTILRLPGLFGPGLKKNVIFDLLHDNQLEKINPESRFQYYDVSRLWQDVETVIAADLDLVHFATEPVATSEILEHAFPEARVGAEATRPVHYDFRTRHADLFDGRDGYVFSREQVLEQLADYVASTRSEASR